MTAPALDRIPSTYQQMLVILSRPVPVTPYPTPTKTNPVPSRENRNGITSISRARSVCWTSQRVPATK
jgi:hypothetical protein